MGGTSSSPITDPIELVLTKARVYAYKRKYLQVYIFSSWVSEMRTLKHAYGGNVYRHGSGWKWLLSSRKLLLELTEKLEKHLPSSNHFEDPILKYYKEKDPS